MPREAALEKAKKRQKKKKKKGKRKKEKREGITLRTGRMESIGPELTSEVNWSEWVCNWRKGWKFPTYSCLSVLFR